MRVGQCQIPSSVCSSLLVCLKSRRAVIVSGKERALVGSDTDFWPCHQQTTYSLNKSFVPAGPHFPHLLLIKRVNYLILKALSFCEIQTRI